MLKPTRKIGPFAQKKIAKISCKNGEDSTPLGQSSGRIKRSAIVVLAVTFQRLIDQPSRNWGAEEQLLLVALRRSKSDLSDASEEQLSDYLIGLSSEQMRGVVSNVKGIYHELLVVEAENSDGDGVAAHLPEATNQPGYDIEFVVDGDIIELAQLKAVASTQYVFEHLAKYPEIGVMATEEIAAIIPGVSSSGHSNTELEEFVGDALNVAGNEPLSEELIEAASASLLVQAAFVGTRAMRSGKVTERELKSALGDIGVGLTTAVVLDALLSGGV